MARDNATHYHVYLTSGDLIRATQALVDADRPPTEWRVLDDRGGTGYWRISVPIDQAKSVATLRRLMRLGPPHIHPIERVWE